MKSNLYTSNLFYSIEQFGWVLANFFYHLTIHCILKNLLISKEVRKSGDATRSRGAHRRPFKSLDQGRISLLGRANGKEDRIIRAKVKLNENLL